MFRCNLFKMILPVCLVLPFTGCTATAIDAVTVSPTLTHFEGSGHVQLTAIATIGHGTGHPATYEDVTTLVKWSTPLAQVAEVDASDYVTIVGYGVTAVNATTNGFTGVVSGGAEVCSATPASFTGANAVSCPAISTPSFQPKIRLQLVRGVRSVGTPGEVMQFRVNGISHDSGASEDMTERVVWTSTDASVATVSSSGLVTATGKGSATITATLTNEDKTAVAAAAQFTVNGAAQ
jgi:trimeric autotransporter adhesin